MTIRTVTYKSVNPGVTRKHRRARLAHAKGYEYQQLKAWKEAIECYDIAIDSFPEDAFPSLCNRGLCHYQVCRPDLALKDYDRAYRMGSPEMKAMIRVNRGVLYQNIRMYDEALEDFMSDGEWDSLLNASYIHLMRGEYDKGLELYSVRPTSRSWPNSVRSLEELRGKDVQIVHEQGYGDSIQMSRFVPDVLAVAKSVKWTTRTAMAPLLRANFPQIEVIDCSEERARAISLKLDAHILVMDLWEACGLRVEGKPYLSADSAAVAQMRPRLPEGRRIGMAWRGRTTFANDHNRSMKLSEIWPPIAKATFIALQKEELPDEEKSTGIFDGGSLYSDFLGLAAVLANLDCVLTVDTAVAHLAGAMGVKTALLLPYSCDWRWGNTGSTTGWYDSVRIFRQPTFGDWGPAVGGAAAWLL